MCLQKRGKTVARKIVITSGKGGVGKSTICLNLGIQLARNNARVVMLDVDVGLNNLDIVAGIENRVAYDLIDVLEGRVCVEQALVVDQDFLDLYYLPTCHTYNTGRVSVENLQNITNELSGSFDYILLDCPAGIDFGFHRAVFCASEALIVTTPHLTSVKDADKVATLLCNYNLDSVGLVVNKTDEHLVLSLRKKLLSPQNISKALGLPLMGNIPESKVLSYQSSLEGRAYVMDKKLNNAFLQLANNVFYGNAIQQKISNRGE